MRFLILTADANTLKWKSLPAKLATIKKALKVWEVDIQYTPVSKPPLTPQGRIDSTWLNNLIRPYFNNGYDTIGLHFSKGQRENWGLGERYLGSNPNTDDEMGDFWFWADEKDTFRKHNQFIQICLHEFCHEYYRETGFADVTHNYHKEMGEVTSLIETFDWNFYQPKRQALKTKKNLLERIVGLYKRISANKASTRLKPCVQRALDHVLLDMRELGYPMRVQEGYRTPERQAELYAQGRTTAGKVVTNAKAGESFHQYGVAVDCVFIKDGYNAPLTAWHLYGRVAEKHGFEWGGRWEFKDYPHLEMTKGYKVSDFQKGKVDLNKFK